MLLAGLILIVAENWEVLHRGLKLGAWALLQLAFLPEDTSIDARSTWVSEQEVDRLLGAADVFAGSVQVGCCAAGDVHRVCALARPEENRSGPARYWCKGFATLSRQDKGWKLELDLGLRRFFIPNRLQLPAQESREGWELEVSHRPGLSPLPRRLFFQGTPIDVR